MVSDSDKIQMTNPESPCSRDLVLYNHKSEQGIDEIQRMITDLSIVIKYCLEDLLEVARLEHHKNIYEIGCPLKIPNYVSPRGET